MWDNEDVLATTAAYIVFACKQRRPRRYWVRPSLQRINTHSGTDLMADLVCDYIDKLSLEYRSHRGFKNFFRMSSSPKIKNANTSYRQAIPIKEIYGKWGFVLVVGNYILDIPFNYFKVHTRVREALVETLKDYIHVGCVVCVMHCTFISHEMSSRPEVMSDRHVVEFVSLEDGTL
ncbi:hypothetical protein PR048_016323 [Dryococelus australis]|uniref:Uncharacterized protein n=1 Tax=Dryococelus australis TaxID=614101 RepID=A0ABQ9HJZ9_9NEOP|nr:hypothetical protein PR048_016323 [Dryococelus australis]